MINAIQLYGAFVLAVLGVIVPILTILISLFPEGMKALSEKYENERRQAEENIETEIEKRNKKKGLDYNALTKTLKIIRKKKNEAETKLTYLNPRKFLFKTSVPFLVSFIGVLASLSISGFWYLSVLLVISAVFTIIGFFTLHSSIMVLFEVSEIVSQKKISNEEKMIELLSTLAENAGENPYLGVDDIEVRFKKDILKPKSSVDFSVDQKYDIPISIQNKSDKMAKNVEIGFIFPTNVVIEKASNFDITTTEDKQIVRFKESAIQAHNDNRQGNISLTFLEAKKTNVDLFIKGENVKYKRFTFELKVIK